MEEQSRAKPAPRDCPNFGQFLYDYALTLASAGEFYRAEESAE